MKLPLKDAKRFIALIESLDMFAFETSNLYKEGRSIVVESTWEIQRNMRLHWQKDPNFIEKFIVVRGNTLSQDDIALIRSWQGRARDFYIFTHCYKNYGVFVSQQEKYYGALALTQDFHELLSERLPVYIEVGLLPYEEHIVWDGLVVTSNISFGPTMRKSFVQGCIEARKMGKIITHAKDL
jgi:hypothetical protein